MKRDSNVPSLDSEKVKFRNAAFKQDPKPDKNSLEQKNSQKLKFSIDAILNQNDHKKVSELLNQKEKDAFQAINHEKTIMQDLKLKASMDSNTDPQEINHSHISGGAIAFDASAVNRTSAFTSNPVRSNSNQITLHRRNENADLDREAQEMMSPTVPPGFKAAAAAAAMAAATAAEMTSLKPAYVANLNRDNTQSNTATVARVSTPSTASKESMIGRVCCPTATLHYTPPPQRDAPPRQVQHGTLLQRPQGGAPQQQPQHGALPRPPPPMQPPPPNAAPPMTHQPPPPNKAPPMTHGAAQ